MTGTHCELKKEGGRAGAARRRREKTRQAILNSAASVFDVVGFAKTGVADIVKASGLGRATFYKHFPSKEAVLKALVDQVISRIESSLTPIGDRKDREAMIKQVVSVMNRIIEALDDVMPLARLFIGGNEEGTRQEAVTISAFYTRLLEIAVHGVDLAKRFEWITNDLDTEIVARAFLGSFQAVILHPLARGEITAEQAKKRAPVLIDLYSKGLAGS